jgi:methionyl-tRNA formyltransferase
VNIFFIGCVESSAILLSTLIAYGSNICGVITKQKSSFNNDFFDLGEICRVHNIPYIYYSKDEDLEFNSFIKKCSPDLIYCFGWSHLLHKEIFELSKIATIGFHPAALPKNKGRHPLVWALVLGLQETASTFFYIESGVDSGDILSQEFVKIDNTDTARTLYDKIMNIAKRQIIQFTVGFENGCAQRRKQDILKGNNWRKRNKNDGCIDFRMNAQTIYNLIRALTKPYVGAHFVHKEKEYKVWSSEIISDNAGLYDNIEFGKVLDVYSPTSFLVKTGNDLLKLINCDEIDIQLGDYL